MTKQKIENAALLIANSVIALHEQNERIEDTLDALDDVVSDPEFRAMLKPSVQNQLADLDD